MDTPLPATEPELERARALVAAEPMPDIIKGFDVHFGITSQWDDAVIVDLYVPPKQQYSREEVRAFTDAGNRAFRVLARAFPALQVVVHLPPPPAGT